MAIDRKNVFTPDNFPNSKCLSKKCMPESSGKMSSSHGLTKNTSPTKGMYNAGGRIGAGKKPFGALKSKAPHKIG